MFSFQIDNAAAPPLVGLFWLALAVTFGIRRPGGALLAGFAFTAGTAVFHWVGRSFPGGGVNDLVTSVYFVPILSGLGAIQLAQEPDGILSLVGQRKLRKQRDKRRAEILEAEAAVHGGTVPEHERQLDEPRPRIVPLFRPSAGRRFTSPRSRCRTSSPATATSKCSTAWSLAFERGTVTALLGANGAGKSTLCGVAAGTVPPEAGSVWLSGNDVTNHAARARPRRRAARARGARHLPGPHRGGEPAAAARAG